MKFWKIFLALAMALCVTLAMVACVGDDTKDTLGTEDDTQDTENVSDTLDTEAVDTGSDTSTPDTESDTIAPDTDSDTESDTESDTQGGIGFENADTNTGFGPLTPAN